jgi:hypothetical protein
MVDAPTISTQLFEGLRDNTKATSLTHHELFVYFMLMSSSRSMLYILYGEAERLLNDADQASRSPSLTRQDG